MAVLFNDNTKQKHHAPVIMLDVNQWLICTLYMTSH